MSYGAALEKREAALRAIKGAIQSRFVDPELAAWLDTAKGLIYSVPVFMGSDATAAVEAAAPSFDLSDIRCERHIVFADCAFVWFERPCLRVVSDGGRVDPVVALQWQLERQQTGQEMLTMIQYVETSPLGLLLPLSWSSIEFGQPMSLIGDVGQSGLSVTAEFQGEQLDARRWLVAANVFMRQRLLVDEPVNAERAFRRRLRDPISNTNQDVHVVRLRAVDRSAAVARDGVSQQWQHQWIVSGHVRRQWYPTLGEHLPIWVSPYVKGPEDRPFKKRTEPLIVVNR